MTDWPKIIRRLMTEHHLSERELSRKTGINRTTFRRAMSGESDFTLTDMTKILALFSRKLFFLKVSGAKPCP